MYDNMPKDGSIEAIPLNLAARESREITINAKFDAMALDKSIHSADESPLEAGLRMNFKFAQFASSIVPGQAPSDLLLAFKEKEKSV